MRTALVVVAALVVAPAAVSADGDVSITLSPDGQQVAGQLGINVAELERRIEAELADAYDTADVDGFLREFANATSLASRGVGIDYAPLFRGLELGVSGNIAAAVAGLEEGKDPAGGVAPNLSLMGGLSLAPWGHPEIAFYGNGFYREGTLDQFTGEITTAGVHGQYHLFFPEMGASALLFVWGGIHLTGGVEWSRWSFHADDALTRDVDIAGDNGTSATVATRSTGTFALSAETTTIPLEVTTSARVFSMFGIFFGGGVDIQAGTARGEAALTGTMSTVNPVDGSTVNVGTAVITANGEAAPSPVAYHVVAGAELTLWRLKAFVQSVFVPLDGVSVGLGLRVRL